MIKNAYWPSYKRACYSCHISMELEISWLIFENSSNIKFHENLSSRSWVVPGGQADMMKLIAPTMKHPRQVL